MRDLCCARCARVVIADFWTMVREETEKTFSRIKLTCSCGHRITVDLAQAPAELLPSPGQPAGIEASAHT